MCASEGLAFDRRGLNTAYELYRADVAAYRAQGQDHETTNAQRGVALASRGRPRCRRTIQLTRKRIEAMGLVAYHHVRRSGARAIPGQLDSLRVQLKPLPRLRGYANCTPPTGTTNPPAGELVVVPPEKPIAPAEPENCPFPPAAPADREGAAPPPATESEQRAEDRPATPYHGEITDEAGFRAPLTLEEDYRRSRELDELKRRMGWSVPARWQKPDWGECASP